MLLNPEEQVFECLTARDKESAFDGPKSTIINQVAESRADHPEAVRDRRVGHKEEGEISPPLGLKLPANDPLIQRLAERKEEVTRYDIQEDPYFRKGRGAYKKAFDKLEATLIVPDLRELFRSRYL